MLVCNTGCTACGACINICKNKSIKYIKDELDIARASIDKEKCINCGLCRKTCPILNPINGNRTKKCFAAWSLSKEIRSKSASGGVASEFYNYAQRMNWWLAGVSISEDLDCEFHLLKDNWEQFRNSKYTYSNTLDVFSKIGEKLKAEEEVLFVGLPCQVSGLKQYLRVSQISEKRIILVDLVCHGSSPSEYLKSHIHFIEKKYGKKADSISFRDPKFNTYTFTFTLKEKDDLFYAKKANRNDLYQIGYHNGISYRDNCYECVFACKERQGDITLADFSGVGKLQECNYDSRNVSCVMINTEKGDTFFDSVREQHSIFAEERPYEEEYLVEHQLHSPTMAPSSRNTFIHYYKITKDFSCSMKHATKSLRMRNEIVYYLRFDLIKRKIASIIPGNIKQRMKAFVK